MPGGFLLDILEWDRVFTWPTEPKISLNATSGWSQWSVGITLTAVTTRIIHTTGYIPGYISCIGTTRYMAMENLSKSQQVLGAKGYFLIPDPLVEQVEDDLVRVSVGDQIACISTTEPVQPVVHRLTMEWLLKYTPG